MVDFEFTVAPTEEFGMDVPGKDGKSAYEIWLEQGNEGTEEDFLESLKGDDYVLTETDKEEIADMAAEKVQKPDIPQGMASEDWVNANFQPKGEYVTETELAAKGYQTKTEADGTYQPKGSYATTEQLLATDKKIPTKNSQLENDSGYLKGFTETDPTVPPWAKNPEKPTYKKNEVGLGNVANERQYSANNPPPYPVTSVNGRTGAVEVEEKGTAQTKVTNHNADEEAHSYILLLIKELRDKFNAFMDSDDDTLDQASELVEYIKANRALIESVTTTKVNVSDIIDNLTTSVSNKPLSAKQGVQLKALIDAIKVPTALSQLTGDSKHRTVTDSEKAAWNAKSDFSGEYADLKNKPTKVTDFTNDAGYQTAAQVQNYAQPKGDYATTSDVNNLQEQIYNTLDDDDISVEETETGSVVTIGSKTVTIKNGEDGTVQIEPLFAESVDWLNENGDTSKLYILPNNLIYAYMYTEGEAPAYTNWLPLADTTTKMASDEPATLMTGYFSGNRLNSSGLLKKAAGYSASGFIPYTYKDISDYIDIKNPTIVAGGSYSQELCFYNSSHGYLGYAGMSIATGDIEDAMNGNTNGTVGWTITKDKDGIYTLTWEPAKTNAVKNGTVKTADIAYIRIGLSDFVNATITINEKAEGGGGTAAGYQWASTGHSFIPTDYEDRIIELEKKASGASSVQSYIVKRNTYIAPVPSGYCESLNEYSDYNVSINYAVDLATQMERFKSLAAANPNYITETLLGKDASGTYDIYKYELDLKPLINDGYSSVMSRDKPVFIITAGLHGIEHDAVDEVYFFMKDLCENHMDSDYFDYLRNNVKFVIVPISNPWGYVNLTYNNSNDVNLNKNFEHGFSQVIGGAGSQQNTGANPYSEIETQYLKAVFDEYPNAIFHLECHGKAAHDSSWSSIIWFSNMKSLKSELIEICSTRLIHQIGGRLHRLGFNNDTSECGYITYYTPNGRPKDYTGTEYGMLSTTMEGTGRMSVAGHTTYTRYEQQINAEALENFVLRVLDALNSRVEI